MYLYPSKRGNLEFFAENDIDEINAGGSSAFIIVPDITPLALANIRNPAENLNGFTRFFKVAGDQRNLHGSVPLHTGDTVPSRFVARNGSISPTPGSTLELVINKPVRLYAGLDINALKLTVQHNNFDDFSRLFAGNQIQFPTRRDDISGKLRENLFVIQVSGPGTLELSSGKNIDLGSSKGVETIGNTINPALPDRGADIVMLTGLDGGVDYNNFYTEFVSKGSYTDAAVYFLNDNDSDIDELMQILEDSGVDISLVHRSPEDGEFGTEAGARFKQAIDRLPENDRQRFFSSLDTAFQALPEHRQREFLHRVFFNQIRLVAKGDIGRDQGIEAVNTLFPGDSHEGDLISLLSKITTTSGGNISAFVPRGTFNAGVASAAGIDKSADELGVVAQGVGDINIMVRDDMLVNQSRVFALDSGDITIWSSTGAIDAGRGAKTALSIPAPITTIDSDGNLVVEFPPSVSGSGIRTACYSTGCEPGSVYLSAIEINAGDAGIQSAGDAFFEAVRVIGADNIQVAGTSVGVPLGDVSVAANFTGVGDVAGSAMKDTEASLSASNDMAATSQTPLADDALSFLEVTVIGLGESDTEQTR
jgi:hypothetical protein